MLAKPAVPTVGLGDLNTALSDRIRNREINPDNDDLLLRLRQSVLDKLSIDNPRYLAYLSAQKNYQSTLLSCYLTTYLTRNIFNDGEFM